MKRTLVSLALMGAMGAHALTQVTQFGLPFETYDAGHDTRVGGWLFSTATSPYGGGFLSKFDPNLGNLRGATLEVFALSEAHGPVVEGTRTSGTATGTAVVDWSSTLPALTNFFLLGTAEQVFTIDGPWSVVSGDVDGLVDMVHMRGGNNRLYDLEPMLSSLIGTGTFALMSASSQNSLNPNGGYFLSQLPKPLYATAARITYTYTEKVVEPLPPPVPEPGTTALWAAGLLGVGAIVRRRTRAVSVAGCRQASSGKPT